MLLSSKEADMTEKSNLRQLRKMPYSGAGVIAGFSFSDAQWDSFESKLGRPILPQQREDLRMAAIDFLLDWETYETWPKIEPTIRKLKDVEKACKVLFEVAVLHESGLVSIAVSAGEDERTINQLLRLHRHVAALNIKTHKYRMHLTALQAEAAEKAKSLRANSLPVKTGQKNWVPKYRFLLRLKRILYPSSDAFPLGTKRRGPEEEGPRGGGSFHSSRFAEFLVEFLDQIPRCKYRPKIATAGDLIKDFNKKYKDCQDKGFQE